jgi:hypothetical protein
VDERFEILKRQKIHPARHDDLPAQDEPREDDMAESIKKEKGIGRRGFFGAVAAAATTSVVAGGAQPVFAEETGDERTKARYKETEHVQAFYRTNRYYKGA